MSKKLYYSACSIAVPHIGVIIDDILTLDLLLNEDEKSEDHETDKEEDK